MSVHPVTFNVDDTAGERLPGGYTWQAGETFRALALELRIDAQMAQRAVERALGLTSREWSGWERGRKPPDVERLPAMAELFGVPLARLVEARANTVRTGWVS